MAKKNNTHYVKNADLLEEIILYKETKVCSERLGEMLLAIARHYSGLGRFSGYTWRADMISNAVFTCLKYMKSFRPERSSNAFAYITEIIKNSFKYTIKEEKKLGKIRDICYKGTMLSNPTDDIGYAQTAINYEDLLKKVPEHLYDEELAIKRVSDNLKREEMEE